MPLLTNVLTFNFARAIQWTDAGQVPDLMEVCVIPLASPSFPDEATYVGGLQTQTVLLANEINSVEFSLVPSFAAGLTEPVMYRAEWRQGGLTGQVFSEEFSMPAQNVSFDQLRDLGHVISGENYVQQDQVGVAGGVAALNSQGDVIDADGIPVAAQSDLEAVNELVAIEVTNRQTALNALQSTFSTSLAEGINSEAQARTSAVNGAVATLNATITSNHNSLNNLITAEASTRAAADTTFTSNISSINTTLTSINDALEDTASLTDGYLTFAEIPPYIMLHAYPVSGQAGMLALSRTVNNGNLPPVHYGDVAIWANGSTWMLLGNAASPIAYPDPSILSNWANLTRVSSVNGLSGDVTLTPQVIGAVGVNGSSGAVTMAQVTNLVDTLNNNYATLTSLNTLSTTVTGILNNTNYVMLDTSGASQGYVNHAKLDSGVAYVNQFGQVTLKDGTIIASGTGSVELVNGYPGPEITLTAADVNAVPVGGTLPESAIVGLTADLAARVLTTDTRLTNARTPTAHAASHGLSGSDQLTLDPSQVTGLNTSLAALAPLTTVNSQAAQISALQTQVTFLLGGGTPTSSPIKATWYDGPSTFSGVTSANIGQFQSVYNVQLKSPFGKSTADGTYYYNPNGASTNEWQFPYITPMGHLQLRTWNEAAGPDIVYATQTALNTTNATIATLATQASLNALQSQVNAKASQSSVDTISSQLAGFATVNQFNALSTQVGNAATQTALNQTNATVATLATQASVNTLSTAIQGLATQSSVTSLQAQVTTNTNALTGKASLSGPGATVPLNQLPSLPISQITGLQTSLNALCPLDVNSKVPLNNLPNLPESQITGLVTDLANKADLINGKVPSDQLPALAITNVYTAANTAAMLALSQATVGDICVISGTSAAGTYILSAIPAATLSNWVLLPVNQNVTSVNGQTGAVNLNASNVGAMAVGVAIPISQVTDLQPALNTFATTTALNTAVSPLTSLAQVQGTLTASTYIKQPVSYVATSAIPSLAGQQSIDGVLTPLGSIVLATQQPSSVNNGLWTVQSGSWIRTTDFATGSYFVRGTIVFVQSGTVNANTIWQETANSGLVDTNANNWAKIMTAGGPIVYSAGNGITKSQNSFSLNAVPGGGLSVSPSGASIDTAVVARKYSNFVPAGSTIATVSHGLNSTDVIWQVREASSGNIVALGGTTTGPNTLSLNFGHIVATNQYRVTVVG